MPCLCSADTRHGSEGEEGAGLFQPGKSPRLRHHPRQPHSHDHVPASATAVPRPRPRPCLRPRPCRAWPTQPDRGQPPADRANRQPTGPTATTAGPTARPAAAIGLPATVHPRCITPTSTRGTGRAVPPRGPHRPRQGLSTTHRASHPADRGPPRSTRLDATRTATYLPSAPTLSARSPPI